MKLDVDAWAIERRDELARIFAKSGHLLTGAWLLITLDPRTRGELPEPTTALHPSTDYATPADFMQALRLQCMKLSALGVVLFGEGVHMPGTERGAPTAELVSRCEDGEGVPIIAVSYARRGRMLPTVWSAKISGKPPTRALGPFEEVSPAEVRDNAPEIFPPAN